MGAYFSARESADYCGVSEKTIRNWIVAGRLSAEKTAGTFRIAQEELDALRNVRPHHRQRAESASAEVRAEGGPQVADASAEEVLSPDQPGAAIMQAEAMAAYTRSILEPLVARLGEQEAVIRDQAERIGALTEQVGGRERELARSSVEIATLEDEARAAERTRRRVPRLLTIAVAVLVALLALMLAVPVWVR